MNEPANQGTILPRPGPGFWWAAFFFWFGLLWWLSSRQQFPRTGLEFPHADKVAHFLWFGGGAAVLAAAIHHSPWNPRPRTVALAVITAIGIIGVLDEWHQTHVPGRSGNDPGDLGADIAGAAAALVAGGFWLRRRGRKDAAG